MMSSCLNIKIWPAGTGFPLPSLSAECLATIAYFKLLENSRNDAVKVDFELSWDASNSPNGQLPQLSCICGNEFAGVVDIFKHMRQCNSIDNHSDLDLWMNDDQQADCIA
jgi:hypothetical protein